MVKHEYISIENKKPIETVYEIKNEKDFVKSPSRDSENSVYDVPSFEEFMKSYERDEKVNYVDLRHSDLGDSKGYEPCKNSLCGCSCSSYFLVKLLVF